MKTPMELPPPWTKVSEIDALKYEDEYAVEIEKGHPLYGVPVRAIGWRNDTGEVLFSLLRHLCDYATVKLTWSGEPEDSSTMPEFVLYLDENDFRGLPHTHKYDDDIPF